RLVHGGHAWLSRSLAATSGGWLPNGLPQGNYSLALWTSKHGRSEAKSAARTIVTHQYDRQTDQNQVTGRSQQSPARAEGCAGPWQRHPAGSSLEPALLRGHRHANRCRWYMVLHEFAYRAKATRQ